MACGCERLDLCLTSLDLFMQFIDLCDQICCFRQRVGAVSTVDRIADLVIKLVDLIFCVADLTVEPGRFRKFPGALGGTLPHL